MTIFYPKYSLHSKVIRLPFAMNPVRHRTMAETAKARVRVEHPFRIVKRVFGNDKVRYRGLERNMQRLAPLPDDCPAALVVTREKCV